MYFSTYKKYKNAELNKSLFWDMDLSEFDFDKAVSIVVQRVVERGNESDWYAVLNRYGIEVVKREIKKIKSMTDKDMNFVHHCLDIPLNELECYRNKPLKKEHWAY
jgi:hypothetical protein